MLTTILGILIVILGLICWLGQTLVVSFPRVAIKLGVNEPEEDVDRSMYLFERFSQSVMDILLAWMLPAAALMMLLGDRHWPILALVGGGVYLYFPGVFIITRIVLKKNGMKVGRLASVVSAYVFGTLWMLSALCMSVLAVAELGYAMRLESPMCPSSRLLPSSGMFRRPLMAELGSSSPDNRRNWSENRV